MYTPYILTPSTPRSIAPIICGIHATHALLLVLSSHITAELCLQKMPALEKEHSTRAAITHTKLNEQR